MKTSKQIFQNYIDCIGDNHVWVFLTTDADPDFEENEFYESYRCVCGLKTWGEFKKENKDKKERA